MTEEPARGIFGVPTYLRYLGILTNKTSESIVTTYSHFLSLGYYSR